MDRLPSSSRTLRRARLGAFAATLALAVAAFAGGAALAAPPEFDDRDTSGAAPPAWFKKSLLDLREDLREARLAGKRGVLVVFGTRSCSYCKAFYERTLAQPGIRRELEARFDVVGLEIFDDVEITDAQGRALPVKAFALAEGARFTPTLVFYGADGVRLLRLVGYYPPEKFGAVLDYLREERQAQEPLGEYLARRAQPAAGGPAPVADASLFAPPPHNLDRRLPASRRPLLVVFERRGCEACARLHREVFAAPEVRALLARFEAVRLDATDARAMLVDPAGRRRSAAAWARALGLAYAPALVFFDESGAEVLRLDAEVLRHRVQGSLEYVLEKAYLREPQFQRWRASRARP